ncbi:MAG: histidine kinase [Treponemataceae bacterium]
MNASFPAMASSLALHAAAAALFFLHDLPAGRYAEVPAVFIVFIIASLILSYGMSACRTHLRVRVQAAVWLFLFLMLTFQFGAHTGERQFLLLSFLSLIALREKHPLNLVLCLASVAAASIVFLLSVLASGSGVEDSITTAAIFTVVFVAASIALCLLAYYRAGMRRFGAENDNLKDIMRKLAAAQLGYLEFARSAEERSSTNERNRLSAELHDTVGYTFTNLEMILEAGMDLLETDREKLRDLLETGLAQVRQGMKETRRALYLIRESKDSPFFLNAVQHLADVFGKTTGMRVKIDFGHFPAHCGEEAEFSFYHFIQEGLVNAFSHGKATQVDVSFSVESESLRVTLLDNGVGTADVEEGIGIRGMRERFGRLGGTLSIDSPPDGFRITATVPING